MSRWRETLCGSVIKVLNRDLEHPDCVMQRANESLSCGGSFLPHPQKPGSLPHRDKSSFLLSLPKHRYEVLVFEPGRDEPSRYQSSQDTLTDDLELIEAAYQRFIHQNH